MGGEQVCLKLVVVLNQTIVDQGYALLVVIVGVGVYVSLVSVGGPAGVAKAYAMLMSPAALQLHSLYAISPEAIARCELSPHELSAYRINSNDSARIVAPRFQNLQALNAHIPCNGSVAQVAHYPAAFGSGLGSQ